MENIDSTSQRKYLRDLKAIQNKEKSTEKSVEILYYSIFQEYFKNKLFQENIGEAVYSNPFFCDGLFTIKALDYTYSILIEAKSTILDEKRVLAQSLYYLKTFKDNGELIPAVICLIDQYTVIVYSTIDCIKLLDLNLDWSSNASNAFLNKKAVKEITELSSKAKKFSGDIDFNEMLEYISTIGESSSYRQVKKNLYQEDKELDSFLANFTLEDWRYSAPIDKWFHFEDNIWIEKDELLFTEAVIDKFNQRTDFLRLNIKNYINYIKDYLKITHFVGRNMLYFNGKIVSENTQIDCTTLEVKSINKESLIAHKAREVHLPDGELSMMKRFCSAILGASLDNSTFKDKPVTVIIGSEEELSVVEKNFLKQYYTQKTLNEAKAIKFNSSTWVRKSFNNDFALVKIKNCLEASEFLQLRETLQKVNEQDKLIVVLTDSLDKIMNPNSEFFDSVIVLSAEDCFDCSLAYGYFLWKNSEVEAPKEVIDRVKEWNENNDSMLSWINNKLKKSTNEFILIQDAFESYNNFLIKRGQSTVSLRYFISSFTNHRSFHTNNVSYKKSARIPKTLNYERSIDNEIISSKKDLMEKESYFVGIAFS